MSMTHCEDCGKKMVQFHEENMSYWGCPDCDDPEKVKKICRGCWHKEHCVLHHISYIPEVTVPMCSECHTKLHQENPFLSHLDPDMTRREAEKKVDRQLAVGTDGW